MNLNLTEITRSESNLIACCFGFLSCGACCYGVHILVVAVFGAPIAPVLYSQRLSNQQDSNSNRTATETVTKNATKTFTETVTVNFKMIEIILKGLEKN